MRLRIGTAYCKRSKTGGVESLASNYQGAASSWCSATMVMVRSNYHGAASSRYSITMIMVQRYHFDGE